MKKFCSFIVFNLLCTTFALGDVVGGISRVIPTGAGNSAQTQTGTVSRDTGVKSRTGLRTATENTHATNTPMVRSAARVLTSSDSDASSPSVVTNRALINTPSRSGVTSTRSGLDAAVNTVGRNERVESASINNNPALRRVGLVLRPTTAEVGGRAKIAGTNIQTGSNIDDTARQISARSAVSYVTDAQETLAESIEQAKIRIELTSDLNKSCQEQYNECMDQFCAVIDTNQKRCSCSSNLNKYSKVESAVKDANNQLNDVVQRIRYVGLSADEIRAIMNATEAEIALSGAKDNTETRSLLEDIEALIKDPSTGLASYTDDSALGLDMNLDFMTEVDNLFSLDFLDTSNSSFSNLRGAELYNAAKRRCNTVLTQCKEAGATSQQITGNYDLAIDKDCIAYEQGLTKMNETLVTNVRSANLMLQKARLAVMQNKNQYDARACVAALDTCMSDDMVCGDDYLKCIDPTKRYIDENGGVVLGQDITNITDFMANYNNGTINSEFLSNAYSKQTLTPDKCSESTSKIGGNDGSCVVKYLLQKIGTKQKVTDEGLCRAVLDKCQAYTYEEGTYKPYNDIVLNYIQRTLVNIRAAQQRIISDYASSCILDIAQCYNQQVSQVNAWSSGASVNSVYSVMRGACRNVALTCAYAVFAYDNVSCPTDSSGPSVGSVYTSGEETCLENISEMFYQSLLCPDNSHYVGKGLGDINEICRCNDGFEYSALVGKCVAGCGDGATMNNLGICICDNGNEMVNGSCEDSGGETPGWGVTPLPIECPENSHQVEIGTGDIEPDKICKCDEEYTYDPNENICILTKP